jgi:hypothetical protein
VTTLRKLSYRDEAARMLWAQPPQRGGPTRKGMIIRDAVDDTTVQVEVLYRDDIRSKLISLFD